MLYGTHKKGDVKMEKNELYINIEVNGKIHKIDINHNEEIGDAEFFVDGETVNAAGSMVFRGSKFKFPVDGAEVIITIMKNDGEYDYNCFVNGVSVKNNAPYTVDGMDFPDLVRWEQKRKAGKGRYIFVEVLKGVILGCIIFFALFLTKSFAPRIFASFEKYKALFAVACIVLPSAFFAVIAAGDYKKNEKAYEKYTEYHK